MELTQTIDTINAVLIELYGIDTLSGKPIWRVVWADDQLEKRLVNKTETGILLLLPEVREVKKYNYIHEKYVLERLSIIPDFQVEESPVSRLSYEPIWTFMDDDGNYVPPSIQACQFIVDIIYAAMGKCSAAKYKDPDTDGHALERKEARIQALQLELFGNETPVTDALSIGTGIVVPNTYHTEKES